MLSTRIIKHNNRDYHVPSSWSDNAAIVFISKYCRSYQDKFDERSVKQVFDRLTGFWVDNHVLREELLDDLFNQVASPNSPQYFNGGIFAFYDVAGQDMGLYYNSPNGVRESRTTFTYPQLHACFIQPIEDSLAGIYSLLIKEGRLFSRGSGTGTNFSDLRGKGERVAGGGTSSGLISFLRGFDTMAGTVKSGGITRRAAKMIVIDVDHPDIEEFIRWKAEEEKKAKVLAKAGYGEGWQSDSYRTVSGQNANNSIRLPDKFMEAVTLDEKWELKGRVDDSVNRWVSARKLWRLICESAHQCADPGVHFSDTINSWNTTPNDGEIRASNPCSEHLRLDNSACNLASINLTALHNEDGFDYIEFINVVRRWTEVLDRSIDLAGYPSREIAETTNKYRDIGLGFCGLGALLIRLGIPYDSDEGRFFASLIASLMTAVSYVKSAELAKKYRPYPSFSKNREAHLEIIYLHSEALREKQRQPYDEKWSSLYDEIFSEGEYYWSQAALLAEQDGLRNAQLTVIAPTGTIGLTMDCETTGIEPLFGIQSIKELAGGGYLKQTSKSVEIATKQLGFDSVDLAIGKHPKLFQTAVGSNSLSGEAHVRMVAAVQPFISGGISKTVNLPNSATVDDIDHIYRLAHRLEVKCISIYRDGCKSQPLTTTKTDGFDCKTCGDDEACEIV